ncbi:MAG: S9 family peptidase [Ginsengibacter sp.]
MLKLYMTSFTIIISLLSFAQKRALRPDDIYDIQTIGDAQISPEGNWVSYVVTAIDSAKDRRNSNIRMTSWDGKETIQLTDNKESQSQPLWSNDGKYISFMGARNGGTNQVWLLDRRGGEARKLTDVKGELSYYSWSPDSKKIVLIIKDPLDTGKGKSPKPYIINRYRFKKDVSGYQYDTRTSHLYLFDIETKKLDTLTKGIFNEEDPQWSPDSHQIAFVSNQTEDEDKNSNSDIYLIDARPGATATKFTSWTGSDHSPRWSPDGKSIAYLRSTSDGPYIMYDQSVLCVAPISGGSVRTLSLALDRPVNNPRWSKDGKTISVLVADDIENYIGNYDVNSGAFTKIIGGERSFNTIELNPKGGWLTSMSNPQMTSELYVLEGSNLRKLTSLNDKFFSGISLASVSKFVSTSKDGTKISGLLYVPEGLAQQKLPLILYIHGGPVAQDGYGFDMTRQMFAAHGYAVAGVNYRGSNGRGIAFSKSISGDWGNKEVMDLNGAVDYLVSKGIADANNLAMSGWSYGGILTDYMIASTQRFKVASSGAGSAMQLSLYGVDQYILQFDNELGQPWKGNNYEKYLKLSYPFLHADRIKTPTQFISGEKDFNVPTVGSEQMYQALRSQNIPTELLVYPGQYHGFTQPSFIKDRYERYFTWFDKYLKRIGN